MSSKPKFRTLVGKKTEYVFLMHEGKKLRVPRHRVRALKRALGALSNKRSGMSETNDRRSLVKNQWSVYPASNES